MNTAHQRPTLREYWFPAALAVLVVAVGSLPYAYGYRNAPPGQQFMGYVGRAVSGSTGYHMLARQVFEGHHRMVNRFSEEILPRRYFSIEWWLFGQAARAMGENLIAAFHGFRALAVFAFMFGVYYLTAQCLPTIFQRRFAMGLIVCGTGLGWVIWAAQTGLGLPLAPSRDLNGVSIPGYLVNHPHFILSYCFAALQYGFLVAGEREDRARYFVWSGLAAACHTLIRPYHVVEMFLMLAIVPVLLSLRDGRWEARRFARYGLAGLVHAPVIAFYLWSQRGNPLNIMGLDIAGGFFAQGGGKTGTLLEMALWSGWPYLLCLAFLAYLMRVKGAPTPRIILVALVLVSHGICHLYPYFSLGQEIALFPHHVGVVLLTFCGPFAWMQARLEARPRAAALWRALVARRVLCAALAAIVTFAGMGTAAITYARMFTHLQPYPHSNYYLSDDVIRAFDWLVENAAPESVVVASDAISVYLPAHGPLRTVTGHSMFTPHYERVNHEVPHFYQGIDPLPAQREWLRARRADYVFESEFERMFGARGLEARPWLRPVFESGGVRVFEVEHSGAERP